MSPRTRILTIVAVVALAAGGAAAAVAWVGRGETTTQAVAQTGPRAGTPPLVLDVLVEDRGQAAELASAVHLYQTGQRAQAREAFRQVLAQDPSSVYAAVGDAMAHWPDGTLARLRALEAAHPRSALLDLHEGFALYWLRQDAAATAAWKRAERVDPDSPAALRAETLLHPDMPQGRPFFVPSQAVPAAVAKLLPLQELTALEQKAKESGTSSDWILYGVGLQRAGRPVSALAAFTRAAEIDPSSVEAKAAVAVARFVKDDPARTFSQLGPLAKRHPDSAVVRFHLGLCLLWLKDVEDGRAQLQAAKQDGAGTIYGREAGALLERLGEGAATSP